MAKNYRQKHQKKINQALKGKDIPKYVDKNLLGKIMLENQANQDLDDEMNHTYNELLPIIKRENISENYDLGNW
tara:strand:+ start:136 stop:357 length:222 start_codon:yes stop_codon:yes gene_type:complete